MSASLINFPISAIVDGVLSYLQFVFKNVDITPSEYRWSDNDRQSKIRICAPFVIDNSKPMSAPFIVVERGGFQFDNRIIDNLKSAGANDFSNPNFVAIANGTINIICGSKESSEASSLANYISIMLQADRHGIINNLKFLRNFYHLDISPEIPVVKDSEVRRWEVTIRMFASLQMGWLKSLREPKLWRSATIYDTDKTSTADPLSVNGAITSGSDTILDTTKNFGMDVSNNPQLLQQELEKGWYYIRFKDGAGENQVYQVAEIIDNHTLRLLTHDTNNDPIPWSAPESKTDVEYNLLWNNLHIKMEIPNNNTP
jgi:hypothetical protein